jgi:hypothetical protein
LDAFQPSDEDIRQKDEDFHHKAQLHGSVDGGCDCADEQAEQFGRKGSAACGS